MVMNRIVCEVCGIVHHRDKIIVVVALNGHKKRRCAEPAKMVVTPQRFKIHHVPNVPGINNAASPRK